MIIKLLERLFDILNMFNPIITKKKTPDADRENYQYYLY